MYISFSGEVKTSPFFLLFWSDYAAVLFFFSTFSTIHTALAVCIPKKIQSISVFLFLAFIPASE